MSDKQLTVEVPEELFEQAQNARIDMRKTVIDALILAVFRQKSTLSQLDELSARYPSDEQIQKAISNSLELTRSNAIGLRKLGLHPGAMQMSNDFDEELPDEFWLGEDASR